MPIVPWFCQLADAWISENCFAFVGTSICLMLQNLDFEAIVDDG
jgi:hypothetical protein